MDFVTISHIVIGAIKSTPLWVWLLFAFLLYRSVLALFDAHGAFDQFIYLANCVFCSCDKRVNTKSSHHFLYHLRMGDGIISWCCCGMVYESIVAH